MKTNAYLNIMVASVLVFFISCKQTPTETVINNYYVWNDSLRNPNVIPMVVFTNPSDGSVGPFNNFDPTQNGSYPRITIQLNKIINIMDLKTNTILLKSDGAIIPMVFADYFYSSGIGYHYQDPFMRNILIYSIQNKYLASKTYTLTIDTTLVDIHGNRISKPYSFSFIPEPHFRVYSASPSTKEVEANNYFPSQYSSKIVVGFNSKIDSSIVAQLDISPKLNGSWTLRYPDSYNYDSTSIAFTSADTLSYNTQYTVSIASTAKDAKKSLIQSGYQFSFKTLPFSVRVNSYSTGQGPGGISILNNLGFEFNGPVDTSTVRSAVTVSPAISYTLSFSTSDSRFKYNNARINFNSQQFQPNTTYTISFKKTIGSTTGDHMLEQYDYSFKTGG